MEKDDAQEILVNAMGCLFNEAEMEAIIAEANGISREKYNKINEDGLELPDCIKKYRELNRKKQYHEEKLIKHELKEKGILSSIPPALLLVYTYYPLFQEDYELLKVNGYLEETKNGLKWLKTNKCLSEYFGYQVHKCERTPWQAIEILFGVKNLKNSFSRDGEQSKEYRELNKILVRKNTPESK
jgi:hypothetical protein